MNDRMHQPVSAGYKHATKIAPVDFDDFTAVICRPFHLHEFRASSAAPFVFQRPHCASLHAGYGSKQSNSEPRDRRQGPCLGAALLLEQIGQQEGEVERLLDVEAGIADRVIAVVELL